MVKNSGQLHVGHRKRLKHRYLSGGAACMSEHEVLELILTYAIPRMDVNPLAHRLINKYGSLRAVLAAGPASLAENDGISHHTAVLLDLIGNAANGSLLSSARPEIRIKNVIEAIEFCRRILTESRGERSLAVLMDGKGRVLDHYTEPGDDMRVSIDRRRLIERALRCGASTVLLAHLHPSRLPEASPADSAMINRLVDLLSSAGLNLGEVVIVTDEDCLAVLHDVRLSDAVPDECGADELMIVGGTSARRRRRG